MKLNFATILNSLKKIFFKLIEINFSLNKNLICIFFVRKKKLKIIFVQKINFILTVESKIKALSVVLDWIFSICLGDFNVYNSKIFE